jgi:hypothetical protein
VQPSLLFIMMQSVLGSYVIAVHLLSCSLDKALHLLWGIKLKYGTALCKLWQLCFLLLVPEPIALMCQLQI